MDDLRAASGLRRIGRLNHEIHPLRALDPSIRPGHSPRDGRSNAFDKHDVMRKGVGENGLEKNGLSDVQHREQRDPNVGAGTRQAEAGRSQRPTRTLHDLHALGSPAA